LGFSAVANNNTPKDSCVHTLTDIRSSVELWYAIPNNCCVVVAVCGRGCGCGCGCWISE